MSNARRLMEIIRGVNTNKKTSNNDNNKPTEDEKYCNRNEE